MVHWVHRYTRYTGTLVHWYSGYTGYTGTLGTLVHWVHWYTGYTGTLGTLVHWYSRYTGTLGTLGTLVQWVHWYTRYNGTLGTLVHWVQWVHFCESNAFVNQAVNTEDSWVSQTELLEKLSHQQWLYSLVKAELDAKIISTSPSRMLENDDKRTHYYTGLPSYLLC